MNQWKGIIFMNKKNIYHEFCTGCGLCHSVYGVELVEDEKGYLNPISIEQKQEELKKVCPVGGVSTYNMDTHNIWGKQKGVYLGWSSKADIREKASSGGILTSLCCYLLDTHQVDGIIQTMVDYGYHTKTVISRTSEDVLKCMGSRYSVSAPLYEIKQMVNEGEEYAFVGKPCDVSSLRMYLRDDEQLNKQMKYFFSFFCAGTPSHNAQKKLLHELGCENEVECQSLQYRGNGWPGFATVVKTDGTVFKMSYNDSWGKILGRDVRKICRFCIDGIGEMADVSCGDAWYLDEDNNPDFSEGNGRNVIFGRTECGNKILQDAMKAGYFEIFGYNNYENELKFIQKYQYERRATMQSMLLGMIMAGKGVPKYNRHLLKAFSKGVSKQLKMKRMLGIFRRAIKGII